MGYDDNTKLQSTSSTPINGYNNLSGPIVNSGFNVAPDSYQYVPIDTTVIQNDKNNNSKDYKGNNINGNYQAYYGYPNLQVPPGYYQSIPVNGAIITISSDNSCNDDRDKECSRNDCYFNPEDATGAIIILICGFLISCIWLGGWFYFRSKNKTARVLGIISVVLFFVSFIVGFILISLIFTQVDITSN